MNKNYSFSDKCPNVYSTYYAKMEFPFSSVNGERRGESTARIFKSVFRLLFCNKLYVGGWKNKVFKLIRRYHFVITRKIPSMWGRFDHVIYGKHIRLIREDFVSLCTECVYSVKLQRVLLYEVFIVHNNFSLWCFLLH